MMITESPNFKRVIAEAEQDHITAREAALEEFCWYLSKSFAIKEADKLAKLVPERPGTTLASAFKEVKEVLG